MPWTDTDNFFLPSPPTTALFPSTARSNARMADGDPSSSSNNNDNSNAMTDSKAPPPTPGGSRRNVPLSPLPPMTPLVQTVSARVMADAEKKLSTLQSQVDALKAREEQRDYGLARRDAHHLARPASTPAVPARAAYPSYEETEDYGDLITEADRVRMKQELDAHYRLRREYMLKQMHMGFRQKQAELQRRLPGERKKSKSGKKKKGKRRERQSNGMRLWGDRSADSDSSSSNEEEDSDEDDSGDSEDEYRQNLVSPWDRNQDYDELKKARAKVDVVICTTDHVPGFRLVEKLGTFKVVVPRSLLSFDDSPEELENAFQLAKMVRQEVMDKAIGQARKRRANAIVDFKYKTELSQNMDDDNVVFITAIGKCCHVRRLVSENEQYLRRKMEESRKRYRRDKDVSILRQVLDKSRGESERRAHARALCQLDERELRKFLDELQTKRSAHEAEARRKADPHKDMLEKLLGRSVKLEGDPYATSRSAPSGRIPEAAANMIQDMFAKMLAGQSLPATGPSAPGPSGGPSRGWAAQAANDDSKSEDGWEVYDFN